MILNENMKVGIKAIDDQHTKVFELINRLYDAMSQGKAKNVLGGILNELTNYTYVHFSAEEELFKKYGYPDTKTHLQQHAYLIRKTQALKDKFESGQTILSVETLNFLKEWWSGHIQKIDKLYGPYLNSKGVK